MDKLSYALGLSFGQNLSQNGIKGIDYEWFGKGVEAMCEQLEPAISLQEAQELLNAYFSEKEAEKEAAGAEIREAGELFLAENAKRPEVKQTKTGLQYEILNEGTGSIPTEHDTVKVNYEGKLIDGTIFDSSYKRGEAAEFGVTQVIAGWVEALQMMPVGSKWRLYIPQELAYGAHGAGNMIAPYSALIFDVELLDIVK